MNETIKFNPTVSPRKENIYIEEFYSGVDCNVYVDGKLFENVSGINFQIQEQLKPLYGYASRTFDDVAVGNRIVIGSIQIPVSNPSATDFKIDGEDKKLDLTTTEIDSTTYDSSPAPITNSFTIKPVPDWVKQWVSEYGYSFPEQTLFEQNVDLKDISMTTVLAVQKRLLSLGYPVNLNGMLDLQTQKSLLGYQILNGLNTTGAMDRETYNHLLNIDSYQGRPTAIAQSVLDVRTGPGLHYPVFHTLQVDEAVTCLSYYKDFARIRLSDGKEGYAVKSVIDQWIII